MTLETMNLMQGRLDKSRRIRDKIYNMNIFLTAVKQSRSLSLHSGKWELGGEIPSELSDEFVDAVINALEAEIVKLQAEFEEI